MAFNIWRRNKDVTAERLARLVKNREDELIGKGVQAGWREGLEERVDSDNDKKWFSWSLSDFSLKRVSKLLGAGVLLSYLGQTFSPLWQLRSETGAPKSIVVDFEKFKFPEGIPFRDFYIASVSNEFFSNAQEARLRYRDIIFVRESDNKNEDVYHELLELNLPSWKYLNKIGINGGDKLISERFKSREKVRKLEKKFDAVAPAMMDIEKWPHEASLLFQEMAQERELAFNDIFEYHPESEALIRFFVRHNFDSKRKISGLPNLVYSKIHTRLDEQLGADWSKKQVQLPEGCFKGFVPWDKQNKWYFVKRNALFPVQEIVNGFPATRRNLEDIYESTHLAYLDQSQKFGWWAEDKPYEAYPVLGLGVAALSAAVLYPLSRTSKSKEGIIARDKSRQDYQSFYRSRDKTSAR